MLHHHFFDEVAVWWMVVTAIRLRFAAKRGVVIHIGVWILSYLVYDLLR